MPVHPEIKKILDTIPESNPHKRIIPEEDRKIFDAPILPVDKRVQVYSVEEKTILLRYELEFTRQRKGKRIHCSCISMAVPFSQGI